jgi:hypothetical protein
MRVCVDCKTERVSGRRLRCDDCRRRHRNAGQLERDRAGRERGLGVDDFGEREIDGGEVVDYTTPPSRVPSFDIHPKPEPEWPRRVEICDGRVASPAERERERALDYSRVPGWVRRDFVAAARMAAAQAKSGEREVQPWDQRLQQRDDRMVDFHAPTVRQGNGYGRDALGRSIRLDRGGL